MGLERKSKEVLHRDFTSTRVGLYITEHTFLDCVLHEMSNPNSKLAIFFKKLDKRSREVGEESFEQLSTDASKVMTEISESAKTFDLASRLIKDATGGEISYKIDVDNNIIILEIDGRLFTFKPEQFNLDTVRVALNQSLKNLKTFLDDCEKEKTRLRREMKALEKKLHPRIFAKRAKKIYSHKNSLCLKEQSKIERLNHEISTLELICSDNKYALTLYKAFLAIFKEYVARRALRHLNKTGSVYIDGSYNVEDMEQALNGLSERLTGIDYDAPNEVFPTIEEKALKANMILKKYYQKTLKN